MGKKNYGKSVKTRLLNLMNETGYKYMYLLATGVFLGDSCCREIPYDDRP